MSEISEILSAHTCLYASFDKSIEADTCRGNRVPVMNADVVRHDPKEGRFGGGLVFTAEDHGWAEDEFVFTARGNFPYAETSFDGTISMWLRGDPDADLAEKFPVDPFHISRHAADGSFYLDLTRPNDWRYGSPRKLRFGFYNDSPVQDMFIGGQLIVVSDLGWNDGGWHHVVATWQNSNSGQKNGSAALYVDGKLRGWMKNYSHSLSWNVDELTIGLGQRYAGVIDEFLIFDVALANEDVANLYGLTESLTGLY